MDEGGTIVVACVESGAAFEKAEIGYWPPDLTPHYGIRELGPVSGLPVVDNSPIQASYLGM